MEKSNCCKAEVVVVGSDEGTNHWECQECHRACDIAPENRGEEKKVYKCPDCRFETRFIHSFRVHKGLKHKIPPMDLAAGKKGCPATQGKVAHVCSELDGHCGLCGKDCRKELSDSLPKESPKSIPSALEKKVSAEEELLNAIYPLAPTEPKEWEKEFDEIAPAIDWRGYPARCVVIDFISRIEQSAREEKEEALRMMRESEIEDLARVRKESYALAISDAMAVCDKRIEELRAWIAQYGDEDYRNKSHGVEEINGAEEIKKKLATLTGKEK